MKPSLHIDMAIPMEDAIERIKKAFLDEGFGTVTEMNMQKTLKEKIGKDIEPYRVLGMCNPNLAYRAISAEHEIGLLLPCTVLVHECGGATHVTVQDPELMMEMIPNRDLLPIAGEALAGIQKALAHLKSA
jgi:uncharacterized protein (DUF302 family)